MKTRFLIGLAGAALLAGCGESAYEPSSTEFAPEEAMAEAPEMARDTVVDGETAVSGGEIPVSMPQIAYVYSFGFRISGADMPGLQNRHVAMCEDLGPQTCRVIEMQSSGGEGDYASGYLQMAVAADRAREFGNQLAQTAEGEGGEQISASISGEDLSKQIVDTEARLRARTLLRDRLMDILRNRQGTVAELVEAERGVAQVNEEIDQAQSWLAEMRGRVNFSRMDVRYESGAPAGGGFMEPIRAAFGSIGSVLGNTIAALILLLTVLVPVGGVGWGLWALIRRLRKRKGQDAEGEA